MKSQAPSLAASTAESSVPKPVTRITGQRLRKSLSKSSPDWSASRFMSLTTRSIFFLSRHPHCLRRAQSCVHTPTLNTEDLTQEFAGVLIIVDDKNAFHLFLQPIQTQQPLPLFRGLLRYHLVSRKMLAGSEFRARARSRLLLLLRVRK